MEGVYQTSFPQASLLAGWLFLRRREENICECALECYMNTEVRGPHSMGGDPAVHGLSRVTQLPPPPTTSAEQLSKYSSDRKILPTRVEKKENHIS
jgi:hypothetical protein